MKATGIVRKVDKLHRYVIPQEICTTQEIDVGTPLELYMGDNGEIILKKYQPGCEFCGGMDGLKPFGGKHICGKCRDVLRKGLR
jgi:transcriptional pleiotropic regulator of transition state genes